MSTVVAFAACTPRPWDRPRWDSARRRTHTSMRAERAAAEQAALLAPFTPSLPFAGPVGLSLHFVMPKRQRNPQGEGEHHTARPDVDNLAKLTLDVLSRLGWWADDSQVAELAATKTYGDVPGVHVTMIALRAA